MRTPEEIQLQIYACDILIAANLEKGNNPSFYEKVKEVLESALKNGHTEDGIRKDLILVRKKIIPRKTKSGEYTDDVETRARGSTLLWLLGNNLKGFIFI